MWGFFFSQWLMISEINSRNTHLYLQYLEQVWQFKFWSRKIKSSVLLACISWAVLNKNHMPIFGFANTMDQRLPVCGGFHWQSMSESCLWEVLDLSIVLLLLVPNTHTHKKKEIATVLVLAHHLIDFFAESQPVRQFGLSEMVTSYGLLKKKKSSETSSQPICGTQMKLVLVVPCLAGFPENPQAVNSVWR